MMTSRRAVGVIMGLALTGCASVGDMQAVPKLAVTQVGSGQQAEHVFCETTKCPQRTQKYLPAQPPAAEPMRRPSARQEAPEATRATTIAQPQQPKRYKVHFRWGWSRLDAAGQKELQGLLADEVLKSAMRIDVSGRTDPTGSRHLNQKLALRRAQTVKAALVHAGVSADKITATAQTPCCDGNKEADTSAMQKLRRTDLDITIQTK